MAAPKLRLVKVIVHPIFVVDDGETLREFPNGPTEIPASEWDRFPEKLKSDIAEVEAQLAADTN
jgi:hypothetical protein